MCAINALQAPEAQYESMQENYKKVEQSDEELYRCLRAVNPSDILKNLNVAAFSELNEKFNQSFEDFVFTTALVNLLIDNNRADGRLQAELQTLLLVDELEYGAVTAKKLNENFNKHNVFSEIDVHICYCSDNADSTENNSFTTEEYTFKDSYSLLAFDVRNFIHLNKEIKVCENCGKFFIPASRSDEKYCDFVYKDGKSCKAVAFEERVKNDEVLKTYRKIYKTQNARKQRNSHIPQISGRFKEWSISAQSILKKCQDGEISIKEMSDILSKSDWMKGGE